MEKCLELEKSGAIVTPAAARAGNNSVCRRKVSAPFRGSVSPNIQTENQADSIKFWKGNAR